MQIESPAFINYGQIPKKFCCDGERISPPLVFKDVPDTTKSLVLIMDDPDAPGGDFVHWLVFNIPPETSDVGLGQTPKGIVGKNSSDQNNYAPPCPPTGSHRYFFKLFAIKTKLEIDNTVTKNEILARLEGNILAQAELVGLYEQSRSNLLNP